MTSPPSPSSNKNKCILKSEKDETFSDLPFDLSRLVFSHLPLKDNIRASAVCKTWQEACLSVRIIDRSPWLIYFSKTEESYELYDPSMKKTYNLDFPELSGFRVCHSKDNWLLMYNPTSFQLFFFNPFTRDLVHVPPQRMAYDQIMAFSCAPTSSSCVLFTATNVRSDFIVVKTCRPNAKEWKTLEFANVLPRKSWTFFQILFSNGLFHCLTNNGCLLILDPSLNSRKVVPGSPLEHNRSDYRYFITEHQGEIFLIYMYNNLRPTVFKLDQTRFEWTERKTLGGLTVYLSPLVSETRAEQKQRNCLCLSVFHGFKRTCVYYKVDEDNLVGLKWRKYDPYGNIWIVPPLNLLDLPLFH